MQSYLEFGNSIADKTVTWCKDIPPPVMRPPTPTEAIRPPETPSPNASSFIYTSIHLFPGPTETVVLSDETVT